MPAEKEEAVPLLVALLTSLLLAMIDVIPPPDFRGEGPYAAWWRGFFGSRPGARLLQRHGRARMNAAHGCAHLERHVSIFRVFCLNACQLTKK